MTQILSAYIVSISICQFMSIYLIFYNQKYLKILFKLDFTIDFMIISCLHVRKVLTKKTALRQFMLLSFDPNIHH